MGKHLLTSNPESNLHAFNFRIYSDAGLVPLYTNASADVVMTKNVSGIFLAPLYGESELWTIIWFDSQRFNTVMIWCNSCLANGR